MKSIICTRLWALTSWSPVVSIGTNRVSGNFDWTRVCTPSETPDEVVKTLTEALATALEDQTVIDKMADLGTAPAPPDEVTPEAHTALLEEQIKLWSPIIEEAGVSGE